jgi:uncharacterized protein YecT (DUF1311 family)
MRLILFSIIIMTLLPLQPFAELNCTDRPECWPEGSAMHTALIAWQKMEITNVEMQQSHAELVALISTKVVFEGTEYLEDQRLVEAVITQQESWENYKSNECELIAALSSGASQWQTVMRLNCENHLTGQRLKDIKEAIICVEKIASKERRFNQQQCLYHLAPLAGPGEIQP